MNLAQMIIAFVADILDPVLALIVICAFVAGLWLLLLTGLRMLKHSDSFGKGAPPAALGTLATFLAGVVLIQLPSWLDAATITLFGTRDLHRSAAIGYASGTGSPMDGLLGAVFAIVSLVGLAAFVRGIFVLRACSDGKPSATAGAAAMHMAGGVGAWHIVAVIDALQTTLGIRVLDIS